jgi:hypothetical protein
MSSDIYVAIGATNAAPRTKMEETPAQSLTSIKFPLQESIFFTGTIHAPAQS